VTAERDASDDAVDSDDDTDAGDTGDKDNATRDLYCSSSIS